jgi:hypothetical protein
MDRRNQKFCMSPHSESFLQNRIGTVGRTDGSCKIKLVQARMHREIRNITPLVSATSPTSIETPWWTGITLKPHKFLREHEWWSLAQVTPRPKTITSVFLLPQKSHECGFIFIPCHKNYRKTTFNYGIPHAKFAMTLRRHHFDLSNNTHDIVEDPRRHWCNRWNPYYTCIRYFYTTPGYHGSIAGLLGSNFVIFLWNISHWCR